MRVYHIRSATIVIFTLLSLSLVYSNVSCTSQPVGEQPHEQVTLTDEEKGAWDATAIFLSGVFTLANADSLDSTVFLENFRANYDWINNVFLPHLRGAPEHGWWECDEYCVEAARRLSKGDKEKERELRESLSRYKLHERERTQSSIEGAEGQSSEVQN